MSVMIGNCRYKIIVKLGRGLSSQNAPKFVANLKKKIKCLKDQIYGEIGIPIKQVQIDESNCLSPNSYIVSVIYENLCIGGCVFPEKVFAVHNEDGLKKLTGMDSVHPIYHIPGKWVEKNDTDVLKNAGYLVFHPEDIIISTLEKLIQVHGHKLLDLNDVFMLVEKLKKTNQPLVRELRKSKISLNFIKIVLRNLLQEEVSIVNLPVILDTVLDNHTTMTDPVQMTECVRFQLRYQICRNYLSNEGTIRAFNLSPKLEKYCFNFDMNSNKVKNRIRTAIMNAVNRALEKTAMLSGTELEHSKMRDLFFNKKEFSCVAIICDSNIRFKLRRIIEDLDPSLAVLSYEEIIPEATIYCIGAIDAPSGRSVTRHAVRDNNALKGQPAKR
ncbi:MAG: FHIPEP family type III secretion protein [Candidatus Eremiobacteraeota bacterium]|nr:FHIPEP family type III secretion protein [Candidatus Eremiobacteraeota bacterium]